jgi:hypothetical protein
MLLFQFIFRYKYVLMDSLPYTESATLFLMTVIQSITLHQRLTGYNRGTNPAQNKLIGCYYFVFIWGGKVKEKQYKPT